MRLFLKKLYICRPILSRPAVSAEFRTGAALGPFKYAAPTPRKIT